MSRATGCERMTRTARRQLPFAHSGARWNEYGYEAAVVRKKNKTSSQRHSKRCHALARFRHCSSQYLIDGSAHRRQGLPVPLVLVREMS